MTPKLAGCPECGHSVSKTAASCPGCGAALRNSSSKGVAAVLSFLIPGLGQMYQGRVITGIVLFVLFITTIWFLIGILFWIIAVIDTLTYNPKSRAK
jgi:hypothetical protein